jgi:3-methyladenine DNA glycosylase AlkD
MARFGIETSRALGGIGLPAIRAMARRIGRDRRLAAQLWRSGIHEARILAPMLDDPEQVTERQMEDWAADFDSWDVVDGCCGNLFDRTRFAYRKAVEWSTREEEFVKRAAFALMAQLAVHDKEAPDRVFAAFLPIIEGQAQDPRNFVRKAVNWALRQIGKRSMLLNEMAMDSALRIRGSGARAARWVASDALRELSGERVQRQLAGRETR